MFRGSAKRYAYCGGILSGIKERHMLATVQHQVAMNLVAHHYHAMLSGE